MSNLTNEQLAELTEFINGRVEEFGGVPSTWVPKLNRGMMRLIYDAISDWRVESGKANSKKQQEAYKDGYAAGQYDAAEAAADKANGYHLTNNDNRRVTEQTPWPPPGYAVMSDVGGMSQTLVPETLIADGDEPLTDYIGSGQPLIGPSDIDDDVAPDDWQGFDDGPSDDEVAAEIAAHKEAVEELVGKEAIEAFEQPEPATEPPQTISRMPVQDSDIKHVPAPAPPQVLPPVSPIVPRRPRTLAEADGLEDEDEEVASIRMGSEERAAHLREVLAELQMISSDGTMPSMGEWERKKPKGMLTAQGIMGRHNLTWNELAEYAKLKPNKRKGAA